MTVLFSFHTPPDVVPTERKLFRLMVSTLILHSVDILSFPAFICPTVMMVLKGNAHAGGFGVKVKLKLPVPEVPGLNVVMALAFNSHVPDTEFIEEGSAIGAPFTQVGPRDGGVKMIKGNTLMLVVKPVTQFFIGVKIKG